MRFMLSVGVVGVLTLGIAPADEKRNKREEPIKVVPLDRKTPVVYEKEIEPILVNKCAFCHSGNLKEGKLDLSSYETMMRGGKRGASIVPGKSAESLLVKLSAKAIRPYMPPKSEEPLSPEELALVKLWIDQGAKPPSGLRVLPKVALKAPTVTPVLGVALSPDKTQVAASRGNEIHVYNPTTGDHVRSLVDPKEKSAHLSLVESLAFSPDGKHLASGSYQEVKLWDAKTGEWKHTLTGFNERVTCLAFSPSGKLLACGGGAPTQDGELKLVDVEKAQVVKEIKDNAHSDTVFGLAFSPDEKLLVSGGADKFVKVFDVDSGKFQKSFEGHTHHVMGVGFSTDGKLIASAGADNAVKLWDYAKGEQLRPINNAHTKQVTGLAFVPKTGNFVTCSGDQQVRMWNTNGGNVRNYAAGNDYLFCVAVSGDGAIVVAGGQEGVLRIYNGNSGALVKTLLPPGADKAEKKPKK